ncbi:uncharacterized protein DSM5745_08401 [Aspergillus mulundensis]|uniref:C2H2-type domain-containing protein n=1 Tax=Aspergillus mulundensis TaxID=1810919 RepID=A0A3D8RA95_9EURO|nr:hypothetical protein DSM5745_08401 [Aspergillus mulundensis]RDW70890.1 hypothetical protein DSM5745_08401 [Aspergillus mulundensis]
MTSMCVVLIGCFGNRAGGLKAANKKEARIVRQNGHWSFESPDDPLLWCETDDNFADHSGYSAQLLDNLPGISLDPSTLNNILPAPIEFEDQASLLFSTNTSVSLGWDGKVADAASIAPNPPFPAFSSDGSALRQKDTDTTSTLSLSDNFSHSSSAGLTLSPKSASLLSSLNADHGFASSSNHLTILPNALSRPVSCPHFQCNFCESTFSDESALMSHELRAHHVCERGCAKKAFSCARNRDRHYAKSHGQSKFDFHCGCGKRFAGVRRDNYLRHLKSCNATDNLPYICGRDSHETYNKVEHLAHIKACKGQVGRKKKNPSSKPSKSSKSNLSRFQAF